MGGATALIGILPTYATIGIAAPIILLVIRILQGLALGGEYGGAAVYVAEHVPDKQRGFYTSFIQITATLGLFVSLVVILIVQNTMSEATFRDWGWRIPFLISIVLVLVSLYIRLRMKESPIFTHIKSSGMTSARPLIEAFTHWANLKQRADLALRRDGRARESSGTRVSSTRCSTCRRSSTCTTRRRTTSLRWRCCSGCRSSSSSAGCRT